MRLWPAALAAVACLVAGTARAHDTWFSPGRASALELATGNRYPVQEVGGRDLLELWVRAEELDEFNRHIVGSIEVVHEFR